MSMTGYDDLSDEQLIDLLEDRREAFLEAIEMGHEYARRKKRVIAWQYESVSRIAPGACFELAVLRQNNLCGERTEILLFERPATDPHWPGELHMPGTTMWILDAERSEDGAVMWERLAGELGVNAISEADTRFLFIHLTTHVKRARGPCLHNVYVCRAPEDDVPTLGTWYPILGLPNGVIEHHSDMIRRLVTKLQIRH